jgi:hypothetical protein
MWRGKRKKKRSGQVPSSFFSSRALREHRDCPSYPASLFSILLAHVAFTPNREYDVKS